MQFLKKNQDHRMIKTISNIIKDKEKLVEKLLKSSFSFAVWKSPEAENAYLMIDINKEKKTVNDSQLWPLEEQEACFVINSYSQSHPVNPEIIAADLIVSLETGDLKVNPNLSSSQLEKFLSELNKSENPHKKNQNSNIKTESKGYENAVSNAVNSIKNGNLRKVVISRYKDFDIPAFFDAYDFFKNITNKYKNAFCYLVSSNRHGTWMGATPERLIAIDQSGVFSTDALAGTQPLGLSTDLANIAWTQKEIEEQAMVSRYIIDCFKKIRLREFDEIGPKTIMAGNLAHLKTSFTVNMKATNSPNLGSTMLDLLHPTSAVCGFPRAHANEFIRENENFDRELFSGFLGPVNFNDETKLFVNLRCMKISNGKLRLFAGAGITSDSNPEREFEETNQKMNTLLAALSPE